MEHYSRGGLQPDICCLPVTSELSTLWLKGVILLLAGFTQKGQIKTLLLRVGMRPASMQYFHRGWSWEVTLAISSLWGSSLSFHIPLEAVLLTC